MLRSAAHTRSFGAALSAAAVAIALLAPRAVLAQAAPAFSSTPVTAAVAGSAYTYPITVTDADAADTITIAAVGPLPAWLTLTDNGNRTATLAGVPGGRRRRPFGHAVGVRRDECRAAGVHDHGCGGAGADRGERRVLDAPGHAAQRQSESGRARERQRA